MYFCEIPPCSIKDNILVEATSKEQRKNTKRTTQAAPWPTMEPEAAQDGDAPVARCPDAPIESTAPL